MTPSETQAIILTSSSTFFEKLKTLMINNLCNFQNN